jgi:hypothetical protein
MEVFLSPQKEGRLLLKMIDKNHGSGCELFPL